MVPGAVNLGEIIVALREKLPADAVICNGAGNFRFGCIAICGTAASARSLRPYPAPWAMACPRQSE